MAPDAAEFPHIAVVGSGLTGSLLAAALARGGARVELIDTPAPAVPAGVSTIPQSSFLFELFAARYQLPEAALLANAARLRRRVSRTSGSLSNLGFAHHHEGYDQDGWQALAFTVPGEHGETQLDRADVDPWLADVAVRHGAHRVRAELRRVRRDPDGVQLLLGDGTTRRVRQVVDTSGPDSAVARALGSRPRPLSGGRTRSVVATVTGVTPFEHVVAPLPRSGPWSAGTVHHVFDGGMLWVAPLGPRQRGAWPRHARHATCHGRAVVGLTVDAERHPVNADDPEKDLRLAVQRFPSIARQFRDARVLRISGASPAAWLADRSVDDRLLLLDEAAFGLDPMLGQNLHVSAELVTTAAGDLLAAARDGAVDATRLRYLTGLQASIAAQAARVCSAALTASVHPRLFSGVVRVWLLGSMFAALTAKRLLKLLRAGAYETALAGLRGPLDAGTCLTLPPEYVELLDATLHVCKLVERGQLSPAAAADRVFAAIRSARCVPPIFAFGDPAAREYVLTMRARLATLAWLRGPAPDSVRELLGSYGLRGNARVDAS